MTDSSWPAFTASRTFGFPPSGLTLHWWAAAVGSEGALRALGTSVVAGLCATGIALLLGTMAAFAVQRYRFFGRRSISFLLVLPITLPGIVTGIALNATFTTVLGPVGVTLGLATVIVGTNRVNKPEARTVYCEARRMRSTHLSSYPGSTLSTAAPGSIRVRAA